jgi:hypothetical protein
MFALGQKQTFECVRAMSALPPKADVDQHGGDVRFVPKAGKVHRSKNDRCPNQLISLIAIENRARVGPSMSAPPPNIESLVRLTALRGGSQMM